MEKIVKQKIREWIYLTLLIGVGLFVCYHTFPAPILHKLGLKSTDSIVELSGFGAFLSYAALGLLLFRFCISYMFPGWDMKNFRDVSAWPEAGPKVWSSVILAIALIISASIAKAEIRKDTTTYPKHIRIALSFEGVKEKPAGCNCGKEINMFLRSVGLPPGHPWCAGSASFALNRANVKYPLINTARARAFITDKSIRAIDVLSGKLRVPDGWLVIWQRGTGPLGHVGFVIHQIDNKTFETIEGNTSSGNKGSQFDGGGQYRRIRTISLTNHFRITHFTPVLYG